MSIGRDLATLRTPVQVSKGGTGNNGTLTSLASNVDWNTLTTPGTYFIPNATGAYTPASGSNFIVTVVFTVNGYKQTAMSYVNAVTFTRAVVSGVWSAWSNSYGTTNSVGVVSQVGGIPSGAIVERGSNGNGEYTKYADGTLDAWNGPVVINTPVIPASNIGTQFVFNLPTSFVGTGTIMAHAGPATSNDHFGVTNATFASASTCSVIIRNGANAQSFVIRYIAKGRWY